MPSRRSSGTPRKRTSQSEQLYEQLHLPLFEPLVGHGLQQIHYRPWVGDDEKIRRGRKPAPEAWEDWPYVETHPPHVYAGLFFDIDKLRQAGSTRSTGPVPTGRSARTG